MHAWTLKKKNVCNDVYYLIYLGLCINKYVVSADPNKSLVYFLLFFDTCHTVLT